MKVINQKSKIVAVSAEGNLTNTEVNFFRKKNLICEMSDNASGQKTGRFMFALLIHIYYPHSWNQIFKERLKLLEPHSPLILINLCNTIANKEQIIQDIKDNFPQAWVIITPNKGRDIGGKLALIDLFINTRQEPDYLVLLHDKLSPHAITGERWRTKLFHVVEPGKVRSILQQFKDERVGVIGANEFIKSEFDQKTNKFETTNSAILQDLIKRYNLHLHDYRFIAGSMFWIRSKIINRFFSLHPALRCREMLEAGDFTDQHQGTYTHSWERLFCWLAIDQGYTIKGV